MSDNATAINDTQEATTQETQTAEVKESEKQTTKAAITPDIVSTTKEELKVFDYLDTLINNVTTDQKNIKEMRELMDSTVDQNAFCTELKDLAFTSKQLDYLQEMVVNTSKIASKSSEMLQASQHTALIEAFDSGLQEEYGKAGMKKAEEAFTAFCKTNGLEENALKKSLSAPERITLINKLLTKDVEKLKEFETRKVQHNMREPKLSGEKYPFIKREYK